MVSYRNAFSHTSTQTHNFFHTDTKSWTVALLLPHSRLTLNIHTSHITHTHICTYSHSRKFPHLQYSAADVPVTGLAPDPELCVVVGLTVRCPVPARGREETVCQFKCASFFDAFSKVLVIITTIESHSKSI